MALDSNLALHLVFQRLSHGLVKLDEHLDGELRAEGTAGDHLVERLGEAHADGGPPIQLEGGHRLACAAGRLDHPGLDWTGRRRI